ncbi:MAG: hypothetical protein R3315_06185, partial [Woeseiaceae bacterium]|nr:hypothetical protein [Woeseiaceae bacterium]
MPARPKTVIFVHGWSVTNLDTYGGLPARLQAEAAARGQRLDIEHVWLGRYISFNDEVRLEDVSRAFEAALRDRLGRALADGRRFACITHSTGAPVIRDWWHRYHAGHICPISHLVMLAPANFGSALARLGKGRLGRIKAWVGGVEPGTGILDWLELGSPESWALNVDWIRTESHRVGVRGLFPFVLSGQTIDRAIYDHLNSYTGEAGSDGVVRIAAANLNARLVTLRQDTADAELCIDGVESAPDTVFGIVPGAAHSGKSLGIMRSVDARRGRRQGAALVGRVLDCLAVEDKGDYRRLLQEFREANERVQEDECVDTVERAVPGLRHYFVDRHSMLVFRLRDDRGHPVDDFDLLLTAGPQNDPDALPRGFFGDRQRNSRSRNVLTYYLNYDLMTGVPARRSDGRIVREASAGIDRLGIVLRPRPRDGFVHYRAAGLPASRELLDAILVPNATTL